LRGPPVSLRYDAGKSAHPDMPAPSKSRTARVLKVRRIAIDTYRENVAYLHRDCSV